MPAREERKPATVTLAAFELPPLWLLPELPVAPGAPDEIVAAVYI